MMMRLTATCGASQQQHHQRGQGDLHWINLVAHISSIMADIIHQVHVQLSRCGMDHLGKGLVRTKKVMEERFTQAKLAAYAMAFG